LSSGKHNAHKLLKFFSSLPNYVIVNRLIVACIDGQLLENKTSSTKPEVHTGIHFNAARGIPSHGHRQHAKKIR